LLQITTTTTNNNSDNNDNNNFAPYLFISSSFSGVCDPAMREKHYCQDHGKSVHMRSKTSTKVTYSDTPGQATFSKMFFSNAFLRDTHGEEERCIRGFWWGKPEGRRLLGRPGH
jgi:hypothetical protein